MRKPSKVAVAVAGGALAVATAGTAYAYWTTSGEGTGSAATSAGAANLTVTETSTITNMYPGDAPQSISGTVVNNAENAAYVTKVVVSISGVTKAAGTVGTCDATDYTLAGADMAVTTDVASGGSVNFSGASLKFHNKTTNQDACKGATVNLDYVAS